LPANASTVGNPSRNLPRKWGAFCNIPFVMNAKKVSALAQPQIKMDSAITDCLKGNDRPLLLTLASLRAR